MKTCVKRLSLQYSSKGFVFGPQSCLTLFGSSLTTASGCDKIVCEVCCKSKILADKHLIVSCPTHPQILKPNAIYFIKVSESYFINMAITE